MARKEETHISTTPEIKQMLKEMADKESRSMRTVLGRIIKEAYDRAMKNG